MRYPNLRPARCTRMAAPGLALLVALTASACGLLSAGDPEPRSGYVLEVANVMPHDMLIAYDDGNGARLLGTVPAGESQLFTIVNPANEVILVEAVDVDRTHAVRHSVTLDLEAPVTVRLERLASNRP